MADSEYKIRITAEVREALDAMAKAKDGLDDVGSSSKSAVGPMLHLAGSTRSLSSSLNSLATGKGGTGALLQVASSSRGALTAMKALGGGGAAAAAGITAAVVGVTAAIALTGAEIAKNQMGTENWAKASVGFIGRVTDGWNSMMTTLGEFWDQTAIGSIMKEMDNQAKAAAVVSAKEQVDEQRRLNALTGKALEDEIAIAEAAGDAAKAAGLYNKLLDERKKKEENLKKERDENERADEERAAMSEEQEWAKADGERLSRQGRAMETIQGIAAQEADGLKASQRRMLDTVAADASSVSNVGNNFRYDPWMKNYYRADGGADPVAQRRLEQNIGNLAASGVSAETIAAQLANSGFTNPEELVKMLEKVRDSSDRIPREFGAELFKHIKPAVIAWE